jgi:hypothetical protein
LKWAATYLIEEGGMEQPGTDANKQKAELGGNEPGMMAVTDNLAEAGEGKGYYKGGRGQESTRTGGQGRGSELKKAFVTVLTNSAM